MITLAIVKHLAAKGGSYGAALDYVMYKHDESSNAMIRDGRGNPILREEFYMDGINCEPLMFPTECREVNNYFHKNQSKDEILFHHFIVSFDPKDATDYELKPPKAQELALEWGEKCMPGFQILVCTHTDGHNESGNIHAHLFVNSVRKFDTDEHAYGERPIDHMAGYKLHLTNGYLEHMKSELMDICERENLHQVNLLEKADRRVTDREYYAQKKGQRELDQTNREIRADGLEPVQTKFQTVKEEIRHAIEDCAKISSSEDEFINWMKSEYDIDVKESRGRWSYRPEGREKYISGRSLGAGYEKEAILAELEKGRQPMEVPEKTKIIHDVRRNEMPDYECRAIFVMETRLGLVVDLQECAKAQMSYAYANKVKISNLQTMAETILFMQKNGFHSIAEVDSTFNVLSQRAESIKNELGSVNQELHQCNEDIHYLGQYYANKDAYSKAKTADDPKLVMKYTIQIEKYKEADQFLKMKYPDQKPSLSQVKKRRNDLIDKRNDLQKQQVSLTGQLKCLEHAKINAKTMLETRQVIQDMRHSKQPEVVGRGDHHYNDMTR